MKVGEKHVTFYLEIEELTCIGYLKIKRARELAYLQSTGIMCLSCLNTEKACAYLKSSEQVCPRRDASSTSK